MTRKIVRAIDKVDALRYQIMEINCVDDSCKPSDYADVEIVEEAKYILSTYRESGHINSDMLRGLDGVEALGIAGREYKQLVKFIKVYG